VAREHTEDGDPTIRTKKERSVRRGAEVTGGGENRTMSSDVAGGEKRCWGKHFRTEQRGDLNRED